jgi:3-deoxy-7-phosphoheptulonate synthase
MRVYFEKPRTTIGWKGLVYDPDLDGSYNIEKGLRLVRKILLGITEMGLPAGSEMLDPVTPQYTADLISWAAIGARTSESQPHRQLASGLSMAVGFKNATDGSIQVAVDAVKTASSKHAFLGVTSDGRTGVFSTTGNPYCHVILRGGGPGGTNYGSEHIAFTRELLKKADLPQTIMVDCSHGNSGKQPENQITVMKDVIQQVKNGESGIFGTMLESNLKTGTQDLKDRTGIDPALSITDNCLGWEETEALIREAYDLLGSSKS